MSIRSTRSPWIAGLLAAAIALPNGALLRAQTTKAPATTATAKPAQTPTPPVGSNADTGWPRTVALKSGTAVWYQPQIESWTGQKQMIGWSAVAFTPAGAKEAALGTIKLEAATQVAVDDRVVRLDMKIVQYNFPSLSPDQVKALVADVQDLPPYQRILDLDRVLAYVADSPLQPKNAEGIKADPPKIFSATAPAILVNIDGEAIWSPIKDLDLKYVLNTNWDLFEHTPSKTYYLRVENSWLLAPAVTGPWTPVQKLPDSFKKLPADDNWKDLKDAIPGKKFNDKTKPKVFVSLEPAELILIEGPIAYKPVQGAGQLLWVSNTEADLFRMGQTGDFYFLVAGRWFKSAGLDGPWTFATPSLPEEFKQIPLEHDRSRVLASVPGTPAANEAILLAMIPRTAKVSKKDTKAPDVVYQGGTPQFKVIDGAQGGLQQAVNTDKDIIKLGDTYYMCFQGVWFIAKAPEGPWTVADSIPKEIYSIPASSSVNHVTYVTVEDNDDEWVTFAYVAAYTGLMIGWGCVVWGSGWYYPPYRWPGGYYPYPHTYGMGAWYNPYSGAYGRGYAAYGPYGGVGMGAAYNPRTGTYARGATAYGPYGSRSYAQAYNPRTGTYAQTRQGSNVYGNWGTSTVQRGDNWAQTAHSQNYRTGSSTSAIRTSEGSGAVTRSGQAGRTTVGQTQGGDIYAGHDGNVYKKTDSGWEQANANRPSPASTSTATTRQGTGTATTRPTTTSPTSTSQLNRDAKARSSGNTATTNRSTWQSSGATRAGAGSMGRVSGGARGGRGR
jgi:hypothetical protein